MAAIQFNCRAGKLKPAHVTCLRLEIPKILLLTE